MDHLRKLGSASYSTSSTLPDDLVSLNSGVAHQGKARRFMGSGSSEYSDSTQDTTATSLETRSCSTTSSDVSPLTRILKEEATFEAVSRRMEDASCSSESSSSDISRGREHSTHSSDYGRDSEFFWETGFKPTLAKLLDVTLSAKGEDQESVGSSAIFDEPQSLDDLPEKSFNEQNHVKSRSKESIADSDFNEEAHARSAARKPFNTRTYTANDSVKNWVEKNPLSERAVEDSATRVNDFVEQYKAMLVSQFNSFKAQLKQLEEQIKLLEIKNAALSAELTNERKQSQHAEKKPNPVNEKSIPKIIDRPAAQPTVVKQVTDKSAHVDYGKYSVQYQKNSEPQGSYFPQTIFITPVVYNWNPANVIWNGQVTLSASLYPVYPMYPVPVFTYTSSFYPVRYI